MSAYSQSKVVLSASELFKHRLKKDSSLPVRGGQKDFTPDGFWMQAKALETLIQEKTAIISEPRVEKLKHLVEGVWDETKKLVNLKRPGKFWMHMGFTDSRRNWLYPEEALFLLETNNLEIFYNGIPMSIQEAYMKVLGADVSVEEYQVFAHLRRLGYVVLRHEKERVFTDYECKIKIDQYSKKKKKKMKKEAKGLHVTTQGSAVESKEGEKIEQENGCLSSFKTKEDCDSNQETSVNSEGNLIDSTENTSDQKGSQEAQKHKLATDEMTEEEIKKRKTCRSGEEDYSTNVDIDKCAETSDESFGNFFNVSSWSMCFTGKDHKKTEEKDVENKTLKQTAMDQPSDDLFPDIANKQTLTLQCADTKLFPLYKEGEDQVVFDVSDYRAKNPALPITKEEKLEDANKMRMKELDFSFVEWSQKRPQVEAKNWADFKKKMIENAAEAATSTPLDHLWNDSITPLIKPQDATSYERILENLRIIQSASNDTLLPESVPEGVKISFDVHLPDHRFKKSMPGVPNHRVCVSSIDDSPPSLAVTQHLWKECKDGVPLHWAVVDSGEITFFAFNNSHPLETLK